METRTVDQIVCPACHASLSAAAEQCSECGTPTRGESAATRPPGTVPFLDRPWVILSLLFFVMAILGLPILWQSRAFGTWAKIGLSIVVTLYTLAWFWGVGLIIQNAIQSIKDAMG